MNVCVLFLLTEGWRVDVWRFKKVKLSSRYKSLDTNFQVEIKVLEEVI